MNPLRLVLAILLATGWFNLAHAEPIEFDELLRAYLIAAKQVSAGDDRADVLSKLKPEIEKHPDSHHAALVKKFAGDLEESVKQADVRVNSGRTPERHAAEFLSESKLPLYLLWYSANWEHALPKFIEKWPQDPAVLLLKQDRECIDDLLAQLRNDAPTRGSDLDTDSRRAARVSDLALALIEKISACKFHLGPSSDNYFHQGSRRRDQICEQVAAWWRENKDKSPAEGIRAQLPNGDFYAQITMAENLVRVAGEASPQDREHGLEVLRRLARPADDYGVKAAQSLERLGDSSLVDSYTQSLRSSLTSRGRHFDHSMGALFYLAERGGREQWELLHDIAVRDLQQEAESQSGKQAYVLGSLLNAKAAATSPLAIPLLGLGLSRTKNAGSRYINETIGSQSFSTADKAAQQLQKLTGQEFGYRIEGTADERAAAIAKAKKWWDDEGAGKFTFEYIEQKLMKTTADKAP